MTEQEPKSECITKERLEDLYINKKLTLKQISKIIDRCETTTWTYFKKLGIPTRSRACAWAGKRHSEETKAKIRATHLRELNPNWNGGIRRTKDGVLIHCPEHPRADNMGYVKRATLMVEKVLDRFLKANELVHHINFNCFDDRHRNFLVCTNRYHMSIHSKIRWRGLKHIFYLYNLQGEGGEG